jgi:hypothetical protein
MKTADAIMDCFATQRMRDEMVALRYAMQADFDDGLDNLSGIDSALAPESNQVPGDLPYLRWVAPSAEGPALPQRGALAPPRSDERPSDAANSASPRLPEQARSTSAASEDAQDCPWLREALFSAAEWLHELGEHDACHSMRTAATSVEPAGAWMPEVELTLKAELALPTLPSALRYQLDRSLREIINARFKSAAPVRNL